MITVDNTCVYGWESALRGMRNPLNSWDKSDTDFNCLIDGFPESGIGENDLDLMRRLADAGSDHSKYLRMLVVTCDITAPLYWWKEFDTYKVSTVRNSCSTMHTIHKKEFTLDDFSHDHLSEFSLGFLQKCINVLNKYRLFYLEEKSKETWYQIIQLLPSSYNQRSTVMLNYQVLKAMYHARKTHKLDEWREFCSWIESLPCSELILGGKQWTR